MYLWKILFSVIVLNQLLFGENSIILKNADSLISFSRDTVIAGGHVTILHKNITIKGDMLKFIKSDNFLEMSNNVNVYRNRGENFFADTMTYFKNSSIFTANSNVKGEFKKENLYLQSDSIFYNLKDKFGWIWHNPLVYIVKPKDTINITGDSIYINRKNSYVVSIGNAKIESKSFNVFGDSLLYYSNLDSFIVKGKKPLITTKKDSISGNLIFAKLYSKKNIIKNLSIFDSVRIANSNDTINKYWLTAQKMYVSFKGSKNSIDYVNFWQSPLCKFYQVRERKWIDIVADSIFVLFEDSNKIKRLQEYNNSKLFSYKDAKYKDYFFGDTIVTYFSNNKITYMKTFMHSIAGYNSFDNGKRAFNKVSGDSVNINFKNGKPSIIDMFGRIEGNLISENKKTERINR